MKRQLPTPARYACLVLTALLISAGASGQDISGKVNGSGGGPLYNANLLLLKSADSSLVKGVISDKNGDFLIQHVLPGSYILSVSIMGYKTVFTARAILIDENSQDIILPAFILTEEVKQLSEVSVTAIRPFIVQAADRTIVNVANSIVMSGGTALEVLEKAPGVTVDRQSDAISLMGKTGVIVYINGKQSYLAPADVMTLLKTMPADNIDNIELITNPTAKYDAAGNAGIINIRLKKNDATGTNGSLSLSAGTGRYDRELGSLRLNHRTAKFNFFGNYAVNRSNDLWRFDLQRDWSQDGERNISHNISPIRFKGHGHNATAGMDYFINKKTVVGAAWTGQWNTHQERAPADVIFRHAPGEAVYSQTHTQKSISDITGNQVVNINAQHTLDGNGGELTADFDLGYYKRAYENSLLTATIVPSHPTEPRTGMLTTMPVTINVRSIKADYNRSLSKSWKMDAGIKNSWVQSDNNQTLLSGEEDKLQPDPDLSEHFQYTEQINAAYIHFSGEIKGGTKLQAGLRVEHTHSVANSISKNNKITRNYTDLFPSALLSRPIGKNQALTLSYSYRIDRPNYQDLNPVRSYLDPFSYSRGNPFLKPQYTHSIELKHSFAEKIFTSFNASFTADLMEYIVQPITLKQFERVRENMGNAQSYSLAVSFPFNVLPGWRIQSTLLGLYGRYRFTYLDAPVVAKQVSGRLNVTNAITLTRGWSAELSGELSAPAVYVVTHTPWLGYLNTGVQKAFGSRWKLRLNAEDLLYTRKIAKGYINTAGYYMNIDISADSRVATLTATYVFGNQKLKASRQRRTASEEEMNRTN